MGTLNAFTLRAWLRHAASEKAEIIQLVEIASVG
jgi:hypothetical protein